MSKKADHNSLGSIEKTVVLYVPLPTPCWAKVVMGILLLVSMGFLSRLYDLPSSRFPYQEAGDYETYDTEVDGHGFHAVPSGEWEWLPGGSSAPVYQGLIPSLILVWFSFQLGRGYVVGHGIDVCFFLGLGCFCLICYCTGWLVQDHTFPFELVRLAAFVVAGMSFALSLAVSILFSYTKYPYQDPMVLPLVARCVSNLQSREQ